MSPAEGDSIADVVPPGGLAIAVSVLLLLGLVVLLVFGPPAVLAPSEDAYDHGSVTVYDGDDGGELATVEVRVADTAWKRFVGLSATPELARDEGMLFVHDRDGEHTYVMRGMAFSLDIIFIDTDGTITEIHHARIPADGGPRLATYSGTGTHVLEVPYGYTDEHDISPGDRVEIERDG